MFENFEQEEPENHRLALAIFLSLVLVPVGFILAFHFLPVMRNDPPLMDYPVETANAQLRRVNELCTKLPRPENFEFISSRESTSLDSATVIYSYNSNRSAEEIMPAFLIWFNENGWRLIPNTSTYEKGKYTVYMSVRNFESSFSDYEIYCAEKN